jgi:hypothetical protein
MIGAAVLALAIGGCGQAAPLAGNPQQNGATAAIATPTGDASALTGRIAILTGPDPMGVLDQCSRDAPARGEANFRPALADIAAMEEAVATALSKRLVGNVTEPEVADIAALRAGWSGEFTGIVRQGRRFIYANYGSIDRDATISGRPIETAQARIVCDGGPNYFGVEYDIATGAITHLAFNGMA